MGPRTGQTSDGVLQGQAARVPRFPQERRQYAPRGRLHRGTGRCDELERIAIEHPDLVERYDKALAARDAKEMERVWFQYSRVLGTSLRINGVTGRLHFGHSSQSLPLFPHVFQIWPRKGTE